MKQPLELNLKQIKIHSREKMEQGAVTEAYRADRKLVIDVLNDSLATEMVCHLRYKNNYFMCKGLNAGTVAAEFLEHAQQELQHADWLCERIVQLGGNPELDPQTFSKRSHADYFQSGNIMSMIQENLIAERIAIEVYSSIIQWIGNDDPTTRRIFEDILKEEEEHANDLSDFLSGGNVL
jgi:bacterioferritin